jgi:hypothetical protein
MEMKEMSGTARTKHQKLRKYPELHGQNNGNEGNVRNCTDNEVEMKEMSETAWTKK